MTWEEIAMFFLALIVLCFLGGIYEAYREELDKQKRTKELRDYWKE